MVIPKLILPATISLKARSATYESGSVEILVSSGQPHSVCPMCHCKCLRKHSEYIRKLMDLPVSGNIVRIHLTACRFFCDNAGCHRKIFTERFTHEIKPYARRLLCSNNLLSRVAFEMGGNTGAVISGFIGVPVSASTILRIIKNKVVETRTGTSGITGVDDWAFRKGHVYGTIVVDLETHEVINLLEDREAETLGLWLKKHPEVTVVSRDRASEYAEGAPQAIQVADRFHLVKNLGDTVKKVLQCRGKFLKQAYGRYSRPSESKLPAVEEQTVETQTEPEPKKGIINPVRQHKFEKVKELQRKKYSMRAIAKALKVNRKTVAEYFSLEKLSKYQRAGKINLQGFEDYLLEGLRAGETYKTLHKNVLAKGFTGTYITFCKKIKQHFKVDTANRKCSKLPGTKIWSARELSIMLYKNENDLKEEEKKFLNILYQQCPAIKETGNLVSQFKDLFKSKKEGALSDWIENALKAGTEMKTFAKNLNKDFEAVNNAVVTQYSNGQVEGQVNRLKNIKRRMYGKGSFQLLREMVLPDTG